MSSSSSSSSSLRNSYLYGDDIPIDVSDYGLGYMGETPKLVSARNIGDRVKKQQTKTKANMMVTRPKSARVKTKVKMSQKSFPCKSIDLKSTLVADDITELVNDLNTRLQESEKQKMVLEFQCDALKVKQERLKEINRDLGLKLQSEKKEFEIENEDVKNQLMLASRRMMLLEREISRLKRVIKDSEDKGVSDGGTDFEFAQKNIRHLLTLKADEQNMMIREIEALKKSLRDRDDIITTMKLENANLRRELATVSHELKWVSELKVRDVSAANAEVAQSIAMTVKPSVRPISVDLLDTDGHEKLEQRERTSSLALSGDDGNGVLSGPSGSGARGGGTTDAMIAKKMQEQATLDAMLAKNRRSPWALGSSGFDPPGIQEGKERGGDSCQRSGTDSPVSVRSVQSVSSKQAPAKRQQQQQQQQLDLSLQTGFFPKQQRSRNQSGHTTPSNAQAYGFTTSFTSILNDEEEKTILKAQTHR